MSAGARRRGLLAALLAGALAVALSGCGGGDDGVVPTPLPLTITTTSLADGVTFSTYNQALRASGGTFPFTWSISAGSLPPGLSLAASMGVISGIPTTAGSFDFTAQVQDSAGRIATRVLTIRVGDPLAITSVFLPDALQGAPYSQTVSATGGIGDRTWSISAGRLPEGLDFTSTTTDATITGTPTEFGTFNLTVRVVDSSSPQQSDTQDLTINIAALLTITTTSLPPGTLDVPYSVTLAQVGGTAPFTWTVTAGTVPAGLALDPGTGQISGTPTAQVTNQSFTVQISDFGSQTDDQALTLTISATLGRNDTFDTPTPLSNGTFRASISPYADPVDTANPDNDFYEITAKAGAVVTVEIVARRLLSPSPLDSVIEIQDTNGSRFTTGCRNEGSDDGVTGAPDSTPTAFDDFCLNDDISLGVDRDSKLEFQVPGTSGTVTFLVRVLDWRGDARPDMSYDIVISGAN